MKTERLKCPKCGSTKLSIISVPEINLRCLCTLNIRCNQCGYEGKTGVKQNKSGEIIFSFRC